MRTGVDLAALVETAAWIGAELGRALPGGVTNAGGFPEPQPVSSGE